MGGGDTHVDRDRVSDTSLLVSSPAGAPGMADVVVGHDAPEETLRDAWTWWPDAGGDPVLLAYWYHLDRNDTATDAVVGHLRTIEAADIELWSIWGAGLERCDAPPGVALSDWRTSFSLHDEDDATYDMTYDHGYYAYSADTSSWSDVGFGLRAAASDSSPALDTGPFFRTPPPFAITPALDGSYAHHGGGFTLTWTGAQEDFVLVWLLASEIGDQVVCLAEDDGSFTVDETCMARFADAHVWVYVFRFRVAEVPLAFDDGVALGAGAYAYTGYMWVDDLYD